MLKLNEKLSILSYHQFPWKESEILSLANKYINSLPIDILENIKTKKLIQKELLDEIYFYLSKPDLSKKIKIKKKGYGGDFNSTYVNDFDRDDIIEDGPYCSACESAPCMCSDRERTSTTFDF